jgi:aminopeptidase N
MVRFTGVDLNWFLDQWLETDESVDYKIKHVKRVDGFRYELTLKRKGMQMPVDLQVVDKSGKRYDFIIPNTYFSKASDATVLQKWYGWNDFNDTYTASIELEDKLSSAAIDPSKRLADVYQLDNHTKTPVNLELNDFQWTRPEQAYEMEWNPLLWYNSFDGLKLGLQLKGQYASVYHRLNLRLWFNSQFGQEDRLSSLPVNDFNRVNYALTYTDPLRGIADDLSYTWSSKWLDGLIANRFSIDKALPNEKTSVSFAFEGLYRPGNTPSAYLIYPQFWASDRWNNFTEVELKHRYRYGRSSRGAIHSSVRSPFFWSDYNYGFINLDVVNENRLGDVNWRTRVFGQWGMGQEWAPESRLFAAGANPEAWMDQPLVRSTGLIPDQLYGYGPGLGNLQVGGGLNLRGYNNYLLPEINGDSLLRFGVAGQSGVAFNTELEFDDLVSILPRYKRFIELKTYAFADAGIININRDSESIEWSSIRADAGFGAALEIKRWGRLSDLKPVSIRADFPLFLNRPPAGEEFIAFRWLLGVERAF